MTDQKFIDCIRNEYLRARKVLISDSKITRGTSHSISSLAEDIFAKYISDLISDDYEIWVDPQISVKNVRNSSGKRIKIFRPDVCIYNKKKKKVELIFDLKMDLGYIKEEFIDYAKERQDEMKEIVKQKGTWKKNSKIQFDFNKNLNWNYVVLSEGNMNREKLQTIKNNFSSIKVPKLFTLSSGTHLNSYEKNPQFSISEKAFKEIGRLVKKTCG